MMLKLLFNFGLIFIATTTISVHASASKCNALTKSLSMHIIPRHYDILIQPRYTTTDFDGKISIVIDMIIHENYINFHTEELTIHPDTISLLKAGGYTGIKPLKHFYCKDTQIFVLLFREYLEVGQYVLSMNFNGSLRGTDGFIAVDQTMSRCQD